MQQLMTASQREPEDEGSGNMGKTILDAEGI